MNQKSNKSLDLNKNKSCRNNYKIKSLIKNYSVILPKIDKKNRIKNTFSLDSTAKVHSYKDLIK